MRVVHVAAECAPWSQTGGLGQVVGALPDALVDAGEGGVEVGVVTPLYRSVDRKGLEDTGVDLALEIGGVRHDVRFHRAARPGRAAVFFVECASMFDSDKLYDHPDDLVRFALLCQAAIAGAPELMSGVVDVMHAHDWQAGLVPTYLREAGAATRSVFTIHNLRYQGVADKHELPAIGLPWSCFNMHRLEYYDQISTLKAGVADAHAVTTVSPRYATEIRTPAFGCGLDGFLREHADKLSGIINGIDDDDWDPGSDPDVVAGYDADNLAGKVACRAALAERAGFPADDTPIIGIVSRFAHQKGLDLVADLVSELGQLGVRLVVLGSGDAGLEVRFRDLAGRHPDRLHLALGYDTSLARGIYAGADLIAVPSRFEPCGLTQLYAMRYGALPVVTAVGGLRDTVAHGETGFVFEHATADGLRWALREAITLYREQPATWRAMVQRAMTRDVSWAVSARAYLALYRELGARG